MPARFGLRLLVVLYLGLVVAAPLAVVVQRTFADGFAAAWDAATAPNAVAAVRLTLIVVAIAVPANTVFGVIAALVLTRRRVPGRTGLSLLIDLPLALSPVVVGLSIVLVWGRDGWFGGWTLEQGVQVVFSTPAIVLATIVVSLPFVVRELVPVLKELGEEQQEAAATLGASPVQTFRRIVLPALRHGLAYGVVLTTARALGEYGAVAVVSGKIAGRTETMTLYVENRYQAFDSVGASTMSVVLALIALTTVIVMRVLNREKH